MTAARLAGLAVAGVIAAVLALLDSGVVAQVTALHALAASRPYFHPEHGLLLYLAAPAVVLASFLWLLWPAATWVLACGSPRSFCGWLVQSFGVALAMICVVSSAAKLCAGLPLHAGTFWGMWSALGAGGLLVLAVRWRRGRPIVWPLGAPADRRRLGLTAGALWLGVVAFLPKLFWEDFNLDGVEAFEFGRSLSNHWLPHWDVFQGRFGFYHNFFLFAFPNHALITLFGPFEAAARLPYLLYLGVLAAALLLAIEHGARRPLRAAEEIALWLGLALYSIVQVYSTGYEPFHADVAEMAATDTLWIACLVAAVVALWQRRAASLWLFGLMSASASPGGLALIGLLLAMAFLLRRAEGDERRWQLRHLAGLLGALVAIGLCYDLIYVRRVLPGADNQFSAFNLLRRMFPPTLDQLPRFHALLFPSGILPALTLLAWRRADRNTRMLSGVTAVYFAMLYVQAWTSLHQFTPVMVLPLAVCWRAYLAASPLAQRRLLLGIVPATCLAAILSLPQHGRIIQAARSFGEATGLRSGDYDRDYRTLARLGHSLPLLLPDDYRLAYPDQPWGTDPYVWIYYASRPRPPHAAVNYIVQESAAPPPPDTELLGETADRVAVYVRDHALWQRHREPPLPKVVVSRLYEPILRRTYAFFRHWSDGVSGR